MADGPNASRGGGGGRHLDAAGSREVVFCHMCSHEWYQDEAGLTCPRCEGDITEIITPESDPRDIEDEPAPPDFDDLHQHNPWQHNNGDSDPDEADIEEHIRHGPGNSIYIQQTIRRSNNSRAPRIAFNTRPRQNAPAAHDPTPVIADFQSMISSLMGPGVRAGQTGRSGADTLYTQGQFGGSTFQTTTRGPNVIGGRFTYTTGPMRPRDGNGPQPGGPEDIATLVGNLFGAMGEPGTHDHNGPGIPAQNPMQNLLASLLNPANARHGDAVYSQEALDQIISTLMDQHPSSNAPGPASPTAISSLPKKNIDKDMLGPEGKADCSVCMDDVQLGDEVVLLPCNHWFHEQCASMWLSEHNTCPICRKGIESDATAAPRPAASERRSSRLSLRPRISRENTGTSASSRNEARLDAIRQNARLGSTEESSGPTTTSSTRRYQVVGTRDDDPSRDMPGSFSGSGSGFSSRYVEREREREREGERERQSGRGTTSGSDNSRSSRRSSRSGDSSGNGPMNWLRDRFGSGSGSGRRE